MIKDFNLDKYSLKTYSCYNKEYYFDKDRKFMVEKTEKEEVRQKTIEYLNKELFVPYNAIRTDVSMYHFEKKAKGRADILVTALADDGYDVPIMVIRCGEENKDIKGKIKTEALKQLSSTGAVCAGATNGISFDFYINEDDEPVLKDEIINYPNLCDMLDLESYEYENEPAQREAYSYFYSDEAYTDGITFGIIGEDTKKEIAPVMLCLNDCFMYEDEKISALKGSSFELIEDMGLRFSKVSDGFNGNYRILLVKTQNGVKTIGFAVLTNEIGRDCTYLAVIVDDNNGVKQNSEVKFKIILDDEMHYDKDKNTAVISDIMLNTIKTFSINDYEINELLKTIIDKSL